MIKLIAEIGINHNGDINIAKKLIDIASFAGFDYVKLQKRNPDICVPEEQKGIIKSTPWGDMTYLDYKKKLEFSYNEYVELKMYCIDRKIKFFASVWDMDSAEFMIKFTDVVKIPSAKITDLKLLEYCRKNFETVIISTGMSTETEIEDAYAYGDPDIIMHTNSSYPAKNEELNLLYIQWLKKKYIYKEIGYSGHEYGLTASFLTVALNVDVIERHITLDHEMWGSDQLSSIDPVGMIKFVKGVRECEICLTGFEERKVYESEKAKRKSLRG